MESLILEELLHIWSWGQYHLAIVFPFYTNILVLFTIKCKIMWVTHNTVYILDSTGIKTAQAAAHLWLTLFKIRYIRKHLQRISLKHTKCLQARLKKTWANLWRVTTDLYFTSHNTWFSGRSCFSCCEEWPPALTEEGTIQLPLTENNPPLHRNAALCKYLNLDTQKNDFSVYRCFLAGLVGELRK